MRTVCMKCGGQEGEEGEVGEEGEAEEEEEGKQVSAIHCPRVSVGSARHAPSISGGSATHIHPSALPRALTASQPHHVCSPHKDC